MIVALYCPSNYSKNMKQYVTGLIERVGKWGSLYHSVVQCNFCISQNRWLNQTGEPLPVPTGAVGRREHFSRAMQFFKKICRVFRPTDHCGFYVQGAFKHLNVRLGYRLRANTTCGVAALRHLVDDCISGPTGQKSVVHTDHRGDRCAGWS